jgi:AraC-like DNA-binding protein
MRYREIQPSGAASRLIRCYWMLEHDASVSAPQRVVPDGRTELILNLGQPYESQRESGWKAQPRCFFMGQITGPLVLRAAGPAKMIGIRFHSHTAGRFLGVPMPEMTDAATSLHDISQPLFRDLGEVEELSDLDRIVEARVKRIEGDDQLLSFALRELERPGAISVRSVADKAGLSARQLERKFTSAVGIPPKLFARMQRFQRVFPALDREATGWAEAAIHCGYYDQAHLIRDFREFAGKPPTVLLANETDLAWHFVPSGRVSHFSNTRAAGS